MKTGDTIFCFKASELDCPKIGGIKLTKYKIVHHALPLGDRLVISPIDDEGDTFIQIDKSLTIPKKETSALKNTPTAIPQKGVFVSVACAYGNHVDSVCREFLANGWSIKSRFFPSDSADSNTAFVTFEAGENAKEVKVQYPNAHIIK